MEKNKPLLLNWRRYYPQSLWFDLCIVFAVSVLVTMLFWAALPSSMAGSDSSDYLAYYEPVSRNILAGEGFTRSDGSLAIKYPPGYPVILAGLFWLAQVMVIPEIAVLNVFVMLCMGVSSVIVFLFAKDLWGRRGAYLSFFLFTTYPFLLWLTKQPNTEIPFNVVFYGSLFLFWLGLRNKKYVWIFGCLSGFLAGLAMLIRPIGIGVGILLALFALFSRDLNFNERVGLALVLLITNVLTVLPWELWLNIKVGHLVMLSENSVPSIRDGLTFAVNSQKAYRADIWSPLDVLALQKNLFAELYSVNSLSGIGEVLKTHVSTQPLVTLELFAIKAARSWYATDSGRLENIILIVQIVYIGVFCFSAYRILFNFPLKKPILALLGVVLFYFWGMTVLVLSILRYMTPVIGILFVIVPALLEFYLKAQKTNKARL